MKDHTPYHNWNAAPMEERDTSIQKWQTPRFKPILGALALVVAEIFLVTQVAWAAIDLNHIEAFKRQFQQRTLAMQRMMLPQQMEYQQREQQAALDRKNLIIENYGNTDTSFLALADVESQPLTEDSVPQPIYRLAEEEQDNNRQILQLARGPLVGVDVIGRTTDEAGFGYITLRTEDGSLKDAIIGTSLVSKVPSKEEKPISPGTYLAGGLAGGAGLLEARETLGGELITSLSPILHMKEEMPEAPSLRETVQQKTQAADSETVLAETSGTLPVDIDTLKQEFGGVPVIDARTGEAQSSFERWIDSIFEFFHFLGRASLQDFLKEAEELENIEKTDPEAARIAKAHLTGKRGRDDEKPPDSGGDTRRERLRFPSTGSAEFDAFLQNLMAEMEKRLTEGPQTSGDSYTYVVKEVGVKLDENGNVISSYTRYVEKTFSLHRGKLRLDGRKITTHYQNADGTTGVKVESASFTYDEMGRLATRDIDILLNGYVYDEDREEVTGPFDNFRMTLHQEAIRDEQGKIVKFISISTVGDIETRYTLEIEERDSINQKTKWTESTTVTNLRTGEVRITETEGRATDFDDEGRATGFEIRHHVFGERDDYFVTVTIEGITYGEDNQWKTFRRTIDTRGFVGLPEGGGEMINQREVIDQWIDENGDTMITMTRYENGNFSTPVETTTVRQSEMPEYMGLFLNDRFVALAPILGINSETFVNGTLDAQNFLTAIGINMPLEALLGLTGNSELQAAFSEMDPDAIDKLVSGALMILIFGAITGKDLDEDRSAKVINNFVESMPSNLKGAARQMAENLFGNLEGLLTDLRQNPEELNAMVNLVREAGLTGDLSEVEFRSMGYTETIVSSTSDIIEKRTVTFEYDEKGRISGSLERVHRYGKDKDGKVVDQSYSIERSDYRYSKSGVLLGYHETLIGVDENGNVTPGLKVERDVTPVYGPDGRLIRMTSVNTYSITDERKAELQSRVDAIDKRVAEIEAKLKGKVSLGEFFRLRIELSALKERKKELTAERNAEPYTRTTVQDRFEYDEHGNVVGYRQVTRDAEGNIIDHSEVSDIYFHPVTKNVVSQTRTTFVRDGELLAKPEVRREHNKQYDMRGRLILQTVELDGKTFIEEFRYNRFNQLIWSRNQQGITSNYTYNRYGQLTGYDMHLFEGDTKYVQVSNIRYDGFGRKIGEHRRAYIENDDIKGWQTSNVTYGYDQLGRIAWEETHSVFKGKTKKGDHKVTVKEGYRTTYTYGPTGQEKHEVRLYKEEKIERGFWASVVHNLFGGYFFDALAKIFEAFGWESGAEFVRKVTPIIQMIGIMIAAIALSPFTGGASAAAGAAAVGAVTTAVSFGTMLLNALFVAAVTGAAAFAMNVANGMSFGDALLGFVKGLALAVVTAGLMQGAEAFSQVIDSLTKLSWDVLTTIPKLLNLALKGIRFVVNKVTNALNTAYQRTIGKLIERLGGTAGATGGMTTLSTTGKIMQDMVRQLITAAFMQVKAMRTSDTAKLLTLFTLGAYFGNVVNSFVLPIGQEMIQGDNPEDMGYAVYALYAFNVGLQASGGDFSNLFLKMADGVTAVVSRGAFIAQSFYQAIQDQLLAELGEKFRPVIEVKRDKYGDVIEKKKGDVSLFGNLLVSITRSLTGYEMFNAIRHFTFGEGPLEAKQAAPGGEYQTLTFDSFGDYLKGRLSSVGSWRATRNPDGSITYGWSTQKFSYDEEGNPQFDIYNSERYNGEKPVLRIIHGKDNVKVQELGYQEDGTETILRTRTFERGDFFNKGIFNRDPAKNARPLTTEFPPGQGTLGVRINHATSSVTLFDFSRARSLGFGAVSIPSATFTLPYEIQDALLTGPYLHIVDAANNQFAYDIGKVLSDFIQAGDVSAQVSVETLAGISLDASGHFAQAQARREGTLSTFSFAELEARLPEPLRQAFRDAAQKEHEQSEAQLMLRHGTWMYVYGADGTPLFKHDLASENGITLAVGEEGKLYLYETPKSEALSIQAALPEPFEALDFTLDTVTVQDTESGLAITLFNPETGKPLISLGVSEGELFVLPVRYEEAVRVVFTQQGNGILKKLTAADPEQKIELERLDATAAQNLVALLGQASERLTQEETVLLLHLVVAKQKQIETHLSPEQIATFRSAVAGLYQSALNTLAATLSGRIEPLKSTIATLTDAPEDQAYKVELEKDLGRLTRALTVVTGLAETSLSEGNFREIDDYFTNAMNLPAFFDLSSRGAELLYGTGGTEGTNGLLNGAGTKGLDEVLATYQRELAEANAAGDKTRAVKLDEVIRHLVGAQNTHVLSPLLQNELLKPQRKMQEIFKGLDNLFSLRAAGERPAAAEQERLLLAEAAEVSPEFRDALQKFIATTAGYHTKFQGISDETERKQAISEFIQTQLFPATLALNQAFLDVRGQHLLVIPSMDGTRLESHLLEVNSIVKYTFDIKGEKREFRALFVAAPDFSLMPGGGVLELGARMSHYGLSIGNATGGYNLIFQDNLGNFVEVVKDPTFSDIEGNRLVSLLRGDNLSAEGYRVISRRVADHEVGHGIERFLAEIFHHLDPNDPVQMESAAFFREAAGVQSSEAAWTVLKEFWRQAKFGEPGKEHTVAAGKFLETMYDKLAEREGGTYGEFALHPKFVGLLMKYADKDLAGFKNLVGEAYRSVFGIELIQPIREEGEIPQRPVTLEAVGLALNSAFDSEFRERAGAFYERLGAFADDILDAIETRNPEKAKELLHSAPAFLAQATVFFNDLEALVGTLNHIPSDFFGESITPAQMEVLTRTVQKLERLADPKATVEEATLILTEEDSLPAGVIAQTARAVEMVLMDKTVSKRGSISVEGKAEPISYDRHRHREVQNNVEQTKTTIDQYFAGDRLVYMEVKVEDLLTDRITRVTYDGDMEITDAGGINLVNAREIRLYTAVQTVNGTKQDVLIKQVSQYKDNELVDSKQFRKTLEGVDLETLDPKQLQDRLEGFDLVNPDLQFTALSDPENLGEIPSLKGREEFLTLYQVTRTAEADAEPFYVLANKDFSEQYTVKIEKGRDGKIFITQVVYDMKVDPLTGDITVPVEMLEKGKFVNKEFQYVREKDPLNLQAAEGILREAGHLNISGLHLYRLNLPDGKKPEGKPAYLLATQDLSKQFNVQLDKQGRIESIHIGVEETASGKEVHAFEYRKGAFGRAVQYFDRKGAPNLSQAQAIPLLNGFNLYETRKTFNGRPDGEASMVVANDDLSDVYGVTMNKKEIAVIHIFFNIHDRGADGRSFVFKSGRFEDVTSKYTFEEMDLENLAKLIAQLKEAEGIELKDNMVMARLERTVDKKPQEPMFVLVDKAFTQQFGLSLNKDHSRIDMAQISFDQEARTFRFFRFDEKTGAFDDVSGRYEDAGFIPGRLEEVRKGLGVGNDYVVLKLNQTINKIAQDPEYRLVAKGDFDKQYALTLSADRMIESVQLDTVIDPKTGNITVTSLKFKDGSFGEHELVYVKKPLRLSELKPFRRMLENEGYAPEQFTQYEVFEYFKGEPVVKTPAILSVPIEGERVLLSNDFKKQYNVALGEDNKIRSLSFRTEGENGDFAITTWTPNKKSGMDVHQDIYTLTPFNEASFEGFRKHSVVGSDKYTLYKVVQKLNDTVQADFHLLVNEDFSKQFVATLEGDQITNLVLRTEEEETFKLTTFTLSGSEVIETSAIYNKETGKPVSIESPYAERLQTLESLVARRDYLNAMILYLTSSSDALDTPGQDQRDAQAALYRQELAKIKIQITEAQDVVVADLFESLNAQGYDTSRLSRENVDFVNGGKTPKLTVDIASEREVDGRKQVIQIEPNAVFGIDVQTGGYAVHTGVLHVGNLKLAYQDFNPETPVPQDDKQHEGVMVSTRITQIKLEVDEKNNYWVSGTIEVKDFARLLVVPGSRIDLLGDRKAVILGDTFDPPTSEIGRVIVIDFDSRPGEDGKTPIGAVARDITGEILAAQETFQNKQSVDRYYSNKEGYWVDLDGSQKVNSEAAPNFDIVPYNAETGEVLTDPHRLVEANRSGEAVAAMPVLDASLGRMAGEAWKAIRGNLHIIGGKREVFIGNLLTLFGLWNHAYGQSRKARGREWIAQGEALVNEGQINQALLSEPLKTGLVEKGGVGGAIESALTGLVFFGGLQMPQFIAGFWAKPWEMTKTVLNPTSPEFILTSMVKAFAHDLKTNFWFAIGELLVFAIPGGKAGLMKGRGVFQTMKRAAVEQSKPALATRALPEAVGAGLVQSIKSAAMVPIHLLTFPITMPLQLAGMASRIGNWIGHRPVIGGLARIAASPVRSGFHFATLPIHSFFRNFARNHPLALARWSAFTGQIASGIANLRFGDMKPENLLQRHTEAYLLRETAARMLKENPGSKSAQQALRHFENQWRKIDVALMNHAKRRGELSNIIDLGHGRTHELFGQRVSDVSQFSNLIRIATEARYADLLRLTRSADAIYRYGELVQSGITPDAILSALKSLQAGDNRGIPEAIRELSDASRLGVKILAERGMIKIPEGVLELARDQSIYGTHRQMSGFSPEDIHTIIRSGEAEPIDIALVGGDARYSRVYRTVRLSDGRDFEVTPLRLAAAKLIYDMQGTKISNLLFEGVFRGLHNPDEILNRLNRLGEIIYDPKNFGKTLKEIIPDDLLRRPIGDSLFIQYRLTSKSNLFQLLMNRVETYNEARFSAKTAFDTVLAFGDFWRPAKTSRGIGKTASEDLGGTPQQIRTRFEGQMQSTRAFEAGVKEWARQNGKPERQALQAFLKSELNRVKGIAKDIQGAVARYRKSENAAEFDAYYRTLQQTDPVAAEIVHLLVNTYKRFDIDKGPDTTDQLAFTYLIAERNLRRLEEKPVHTAVLQLVQGGGKTLGVLIGKEVAYRLHLNRNSNASFHDLIATSRDKLAADYFKEGSLELEVINHMRLPRELGGLDLEIRNVSSSEIQNVETIAPTQTRSLFIIDNYNLKRLGLHLTKLYQEKEALQPKILGGPELVRNALRDLQAAENQYRAQTGRNTDALLDAASELDAAKKKYLDENENYHRYHTRLREVEAEIEGHYLERVKQKGDLTFDEIQEALADSDLIEGPGGSLLKGKSPIEIASTKAELRGRIIVFREFQRIYDEAVKAGNPFLVIENVLHAGRHLRNQYQFKDHVVRQVFDKLRDNQDVGSLGERGGRGNEFEQFSDAVANALMYERGTDYFIKRYVGTDGEVSLRYSTGRFGVNQLETVFGNRELGTAVLIKEYLKLDAFSGGKIKEVARNLTENESALNSLADSFHHTEFNRTTTLNTLALVGLEKTTFVTGTSQGIRRTLNRIGSSVYEVQKERPIDYQEGNVRRIHVESTGESIQELLKQVTRKLEEAGSDPKGVKIVITGEKGAMLELIHSALVEAGLGGRFHIERIDGMEGNAHITKALKVVENRFRTNPDQNDIVLVPDFGAGSNLFGHIEGIPKPRRGSYMSGRVKPLIIEMGNRGETHRQQLGARMDGVIAKEISTRYEGEFLTIVNGRGREFTDAERLRLEQITGDPVKLEAFYRETSRKMDLETDTQNVARVVEVAPTHAERRVIEQKIYDRIVKGTLERSKRRSELKFEETVRNIKEFEKALEKFVPAALLPELIGAVRDRDHGLVDADGAFTKRGELFLRLLDDLIQFTVPHELKQDGLALAADRRVSALDRSRLERLDKPVAELSDKPEDYAAELVYIALARMELAKSDPFQIDPLSFVSAKEDLREVYSDTLAEVLKVLPEALNTGLTDEEFNTLYNELVTKIQSVRTKNEIPAFMLNREFVKLVLVRLEGALADQDALTPIQRERVESLRAALTELSNEDNLYKTVLGERIPKRYEEFMFMAMQIGFKHPEISTLDLLITMQPLMSQSKRNQATHTVDQLGQLIGHDDIQNLGLEEAVLERIRESTSDETIGRVTVLRKGLTTHYLTERNLLLFSQRPTKTGNGMVYQFGTSPLQYRLENSQLVLTGDSKGTRTEAGELVKEPPVQRVRVRDIQDEKVRRLLAKEWGLEEEDAVRVVNYEKGLLTETYYVASDSDQILYESTRLPLYSGDLARSLGFLFPEAKGLEKGDELIIQNKYVPEKGLIGSVVYAKTRLGERRIGAVGVEQTTLGKLKFSKDPDKESLFRRLRDKGVHPDQTVVIRTFLDADENPLKDVGGQAVHHISVTAAGNATLPTTARHLFSRAVTSQVSTEERKPGLLVMELDFMQSDSIDMRNDSPTGEIHHAEGHVGINYHPDLMDAFENRYGFDPHTHYEVGGVQKELRLFVSLFYRMNIHEFRGHLRFKNPVLTAEAVQRLGLHDKAKTDPKVKIQPKALTAETVRMLLENPEKFGLQLVTPKEDPTIRPGLQELRFKDNGETLIGLDDAGNIATLGTEITDANGTFRGFKYFRNDNAYSYKIQTSERIAETLSGDHYRATDHAARFMWFFGLKQDQHMPGRIDQNIEDMVQRYGMREADDYLSLIHDPAMKEDVKNITKRFSEGHFRSLDEQRAYRLARYYGVEPERSLTPPEPPRSRSGIGTPILDIPGMVPVLMTIGRGLLSVDRETYEAIENDYEIEKLASPHSPFVQVMSLFFEGDAIDLSGLQGAVEARLAQLGDLSITDRRVLSDRLTSLYQVIEGARLLASAFRSGSTAEQDALVYEVGQALEALVRQVAHVEVGENMLFEVRPLLPAFRTFALILRDDKTFGQAFNRMAFFFDKQGGRLLNDEQLEALIRSRGGRNIFDGSAFPVEKFVAFYNQMAAQGITPNGAERGILAILLFKGLIDQNPKTGRYFVKDPKTPGSIAAFERSESGDETSFIVDTHEIIHTIQHTYKPLMDALRQYYQSLAHRTVTVQGKTMNGLEFVKFVLKEIGEYKTSDPELVARELHAYFREPRQFLGKLQDRLDQNARSFIDEIQAGLRALETPHLAKVLGIETGTAAPVTAQEGAMKMMNPMPKQNIKPFQAPALPAFPGQPPMPAIPLSFELPGLDFGVGLIPARDDDDERYVFDSRVVTMASIPLEPSFAQEGPMEMAQPARLQLVQAERTRATQATPVQVGEMRPRQEAVPPEMRAWFVVGEIARKSGDLPAGGRKIILEILQANPEARDLLYDHIDRIELPKSFQEAIQRGELKPAELLKLLILVSRIHKAGVIDGVKINGVNITDVQKFFEGYGLGEIPVTAMDLLLFLNAAKGALNAELFVEKVKVELLRNV